MNVVFFSCFGVVLCVVPAGCNLQCSFVDAGFCGWEVLRCLCVQTLPFHKASTWTTRSTAGASSGGQMDALSKVSGEVVCSMGGGGLQLQVGASIGASGTEALRRGERKPPATVGDVLVSDFSSV